MSEEKKEPVEDNEKLDEEDLAGEKEGLIEDDNQPGGAKSSKEKNGGKTNTLLPLRVSLTILTTLAAVAFFVTAYAIANVQVWDAVDREGYHERVPSGRYHVYRGGGSLCYVGQDWTECINLKKDEYNSACTGHPVTNQWVCEAYLEDIEDMESRDRPGSYVASLGSGDMLTATEELRDHWVEPETHEAYCYLGSIGECPTEEDQEG